MSEILVAGAGHGGLAAAYLLAVNGRHVTVVEQLGRDALGYDWEDSFDPVCFDFAEIPKPAFPETTKASKTFVLDLDKDMTFSVENKDEAHRMFVFRKTLYAYLLSLCEDAGVQFRFETRILAPILFGNRVCGLQTTGGPMYADLVIDAAGVYSPVKLQLPDSLLIEKTFRGCEILHTYRAYYEKNPDAPSPDAYYRVLFDHNGDIGLGWYVVYENYVDVLIGRFGVLDDAMAQNAVAQLREKVPLIGETRLHGGQIVDIPVRQPLPVLVADGYAAVGDSACMTLPTIGSGITYSIMAGKLLADAVLADADGAYSAVTLWPYQKAFYKEIGNNTGVSSLFRGFFNRLTVEDLRKLIEEGVVSSDDDFFTSLLDSFKSGGMSLSKINEIRRQLGNHSVLLKKIRAVISASAKLTTVRLSFPSVYERDDVQRWYKKYNEFFDTMAVTPVDDEALKQ